MVFEVSMIWLKFPSNPIVSLKEPTLFVPTLLEFPHSPTLTCVNCFPAENDCFPDHSLATVPHCVHASLTLSSPCLVTDTSPPQSEVRGQ